MITSSSNKKIKDLQKLKENRNIKKYKRYLIEGKHLVEEALSTNLVEEVIVSEDFDDKNLLNDFSGEITIVSNNIMKLLIDTITTQGIVGVCRIEEKNFDISNYSKVLILDRIQDPGNLGTIIRTADAFDFDCVILGKGTTSLYGQKVIRSTQGSNFHIECFENINIEELISKMDDFNLYATSLKGEKYLEEIRNIEGNIAVVFGNEGSGVSESILDKVNNLLKISMPGRAESLNVSIAAGIVMHHIVNNLK
ncbi:TrmH family RNA methyltransferase [Gemella cuniculi]|uniref:TrmH family RNA methyltransferase n=1 Tax=Gemella cuniculi TaxID=150240 RepID=UPI0003FE1A2F|nr:RNA methyltransferase [Gemella cuniculi]